MSFDQLLQNIGWTLIHSMWQAPIIFALAFIGAKAFKTSASNARYAVWICALILVPVSSLVTYCVLHTGGLSSSTVPADVDFTAISLSSGMPSIQAAGLYQSISAFATWIDINLYTVIRIWLIGSAIFLLRMLTGIFYIYFLRRNAQPVIGTWEERANATARSLRIMKPVRVAVSSVSTPMVIGYLKPLVLFPAGMLAGLAPEQVEAILIHELAHVRRHDFLVNLFQCLLESVFFFNPFVWVISGMVRMEREHCCDDLVIRQGIEPLTYVKTLAAVEGVYHTGQLAMGLLGQKHQLLNRMKRVMEKSLVKKGFTPARVLPFALVLVGLVCASWLSINNETKSASQNIAEKHDIIAPDTSITAPADSQDGNADIVSRESGPRIYSFDHSFDATFFPPPVPTDAGAQFPAMPAFPGDSISGFLLVPDGDWGKFEKEFTDKFQDEFGEFFEKNREQFEKMMTDFRKEHSAFEHFAFPPVHELSEEELKALEEQMSQLGPMFENLENMVSEDARLMQEQALALSQQAMAQSDFARTHADIARIQEQMAMDHEFFVLEQEEKLRAYEEAMIDQLRTDGYLGKDEKVNDLHIRNGEITVNGKKVREKDQKKYSEIIQRFNRGWHSPHKPE